MTTRPRIATLVVATIATGAIDRAVASEPEAIGTSERMFDFTVCNKTGREVSVAISPRLAPGSSEWVVAGWWKVGPAACRTIGSYPRGFFYMHAQSGGTTWGKGDLNLCVETPGPFKRINIASYRCAGHLLRKFSQVDVQSARWQWTLTP